MTASLCPAEFPARFYDGGLVQSKEIFITIFKETSHLRPLCSASFVYIFTQNNPRMWDALIGQILGSLFTEFCLDLTLLPGYKSEGRVWCEFCEVTTSVHEEASAAPSGDVRGGCCAHFIVDSPGDPFRTNRTEMTLV